MCSAPTINHRVVLSYDTGILTACTTVTLAASGLATGAPREETESAGPTSDKTEGCLSKSRGSASEKACPTSGDGAPREETESAGSTSEKIEGCFSGSAREKAAD
jgi:hypothetical protein